MTGFGRRSTAEEVAAGLDLAGRTILITGCNSGIGHETVRVLAGRGARVLGTARTEAKARAACEAVSGATEPVACELADPASVRAAVETVRALDTPLHAVVCNAGIMALPRLQTAHGLELQFFTNHVGHFLLVTGLLDALAEDGRVVMVSSNGHNMTPSGGIAFDNLDGSRGYSAWPFYGQSKLANILLAKELARRFAGTAQTANAVHPGAIQTGLTRNLNPVFRAGWRLVAPLLGKSVPQGAATQTLVSVHPEAATLSGEYWVDCQVARPSRHARDADLAARLWERTEAIVAAL